FYGFRACKPSKKLKKGRFVSSLQLSSWLSIRTNIRKSNNVTEK
ncbi:MAG: hypothetical protein ACJAUM_002529, partial [Pseudomonadales bacterium]